MFVATIPKLAEQIKEDATRKGVSCLSSYQPGIGALAQVQITRPL